MDLDSPFAQELNISTPNIDALKSQGVTFNNAVCNAPICSPSRASMIFGRYPHNTGYYGYNMGENPWHLNPNLSSSTPVFQHFKDNGYSVYGSGKLFHSANTSINQQNFSQYEFQPNGPFPWDGVSYNNSGKKIMQPHPENPPLLDTHFDGVYALSEIPVFSDTLGWYQRNDPFYYQNDSVRDLLGDEMTVQFAQSVLSNTQNNPFFLALGFRKPHTPYFLPQEYFDLYPIEDIIIPEVFGEEIESAAIANYHNRNYAPRNNLDYEKLMFLSEDSLDTKWWIKKHIQGYIASVSFLDHMIGQVLNELGNSAYSENTYVIFTSDHGYTLGQKQTFHKNNLWSPALDIPLIVSGPGISQNESCEYPVSLIDIYPTILDFTSLPNPSNILDGTSIKALSENPTMENWNGPDYAISAVANDELIANGAIAKKEHQHFALTTNSHRYIRLSSGEDELYDLMLDPQELNNASSLESKLSEKLNMKNQLETEVLFDSIPFTKGSLKYGNFEQKLNGWRLARVDDTTYAQIIDTPNSPESSYHFKVETVPYVYDNYRFTISNSNLELVQGHQYTLSFDAKASVTGSKLRFILERKNGYDSYGKIGSVGIALDTAWNSHELTFTYPGYSSRTDFNLIVKFMKKNRIYEIDNIQFCDLTTGNCETECLVSSFSSAPTDSYTNLSSTGFQFFWTPPLGSTECEVQGNIASAPLSENESETLYGSLNNAPQSYGPIEFDGYFPFNQPIIQGELYRWRVRCGCSEENLSPFTNFNYFYVPMFLESGNQFEKSMPYMAEVFPNPSFNGIFYTQFSESTYTEIFDQRGTKVYKAYIESDILDLSFLPKGVYTLKTTSQNKANSTKLVIQ